MIDINKKYCTRDGADVRILCTDAEGAYPVIFQVLSCRSVHLASLDGKYSGSSISSSLDLVEVSPYEDFKTDDPVMVSDDGKGWLKRYFSGMSGVRPCTYPYGTTSWSIDRVDNHRHSWNYCRRPTKEEMGE